MNGMQCTVLFAKNTFSKRKQAVSIKKTYIQNFTLFVHAAKPVEETIIIPSAVCDNPPSLEVLEIMKSIIAMNS